MPFNFQPGSFAAVVIYWGVVIATIVFSLLDTVIGEKKDREEEEREKKRLLKAKSDY